MKHNAVFGLAVFALCGCDRAATFAGLSDDAHAHYASIGIYAPGESWPRIAGPQQAKSGAPAIPLDDQAIFVVMNSRTGEIRACGDLTGYCIGMNPWKSALIATQVAPIAMKQHAASSPVTADTGAQ